MKKNILLILFILLILSAFLSCSTGKGREMATLLEQPEEVHIFSVPLNSLTREQIDKTPDILKVFPFISAKPAANFRGKFPPEFYAGILKKFRSEALPDVDFWKLRDQPGLYDVIYVKPLWNGQFKTRGNDLLDSIAYTFNISFEQLGILRAWIRKGGVLWMESAIYVSQYDYNFNGFSEKQLESLIRTLSAMKLDNHGIGVHTLRARKSNDIHVEGFSQEFHLGATAGAGKIDSINVNVHSLLLEQQDYIGIYLSVAGIPIIQSGNDAYASYVQSGKGKIITLAPFEFTDAYHDGEIFRLMLLVWALDKKGVI